MKNAEFNSTLINNYLQLLERLSKNGKQEIIARLSASIRDNTKSKDKQISAAFGALNTSKSADELIEEIRSNRKFRDRDIEI